MADPLARFRVNGGDMAEPEQGEVPVTPDSDPMARFRVSEMTPPVQTTDTRLGEEFALGLKRGGHNFAAMMGGLAGMVGREAGIETLQNAGNEIAQSQGEAAASFGAEGAVERFSEVEDAGGFFNWAAAGLGEAIPSLSTAIAGGGVGGVAAKAVVKNRLKRTLSDRVARKLIKKGATQEQARATTRRLLNSEDGQRWLADSVFRGKSTQEITGLAFSRGQTLGAVAASAAPQIGGTDLELQAAGVDSGFTALMAGVAGGALEAVPAIRLMDKLFPGVDRQLSKQFVKDFAVATGQQAGIEGGTEAAQEMIQMAALAYHDPSFDMWSPEAKTRVLDAFAAGALVGTVTGGIAEGTSQGVAAIQQGAVKAPPIPKIPGFRFRPEGKEKYPDGFEPADNTMFEEIRERLYSTVGAQVESAMNSARNAVNPILDAINVEINPGMNREGVRLFEVVGKAHNDFVEQHKDALDKAKQAFSFHTRRIYEAAGAIKDPEQRAAYIEREVNLVKQQMRSFADSLRRKAAQRDQETQAEVDNMDFDDDLEIVEQENAPEEVVDVARAEPGDVEAPVAMTFGKFQRQPTTDTAGRETVRGYDTEEQAQKGIETLKRDLEATDDDFTVRQQDDGSYVVETQNPDLRENAYFMDRFRAAARSAQKRNPDVRRHYTIPREVLEGKDLGFKNPKVDVVTLAYAGLKLGDNITNLRDGMAAMAAKMLERGFLDGEVSAQEIMDQFDQAMPNAADPQFAEAYAPVTNYQNKGAATAAMLKLRDRIAEQFDIEKKNVWPYESVGVTDNGDGTFSFGVTNPRGLARLRSTKPEQFRALMDAIKQERRSEKLTSREGMQGLNERTDEALAPTGGELETMIGDQSITAREEQSSAPEADTRTQPKRANISESDKRILKRIARPAELKVLIGMDFDKDGTLSKAVGDLANFVRTKLGMRNDIVVMDDVGLKLAIEMGMVSDPIFEQTLNDPNVNARNIRIGDTSYIYLSQRVLGDPSLTTAALGHEMGHHIYSVEWDNLTPEAQQRLRDASGTETEEQFNEWMADQLAAWMVTRRLPRNAVEKFFFTVGNKLKELFGFLQGKERFQLNETFGEFADALAERAKGQGAVGANPLSDAAIKAWFKNEGVTGYKWFGLPKKDDLDIKINDRELSAEAEKALKRMENNYPALAKRAMTIRNWMGKALQMAFAPSTSVMRSLGKQGIKSANQLVTMFGREGYGEAKKGSNYHQRVNLFRGQFSNQYDKAVSGLSNAGKLQLGDIMVKLDTGRMTMDQVPANIKPNVEALRALYDEMHKYARDNGLPVAKVNNYFPRQFDTAMLIKDKDKILRHLMDDRQMGLGEARQFYNSLISREAQDGRATSDAVETPGFKNMNSRTARDKFFNDYLDYNVDNVTMNYIDSVVKRAEFNRVLGEDMGPTDISPQEAIRQGLWDPKAKYHRILRQAKRENATDDQLKLMEKYIDANLGQLGRDDISPGARKFMAGVMAYQNMRVLLFTVFASLPDMAGPAIRSGDMRGAFKSFRDNIREIAKDEGDLSEMAKAYGIISDAANEHIMTEYVDNHYMPPTLKKWNDKFFQYTGLNYYTQFTRKMALAVGRDYLETQAKKARSKDAKEADAGLAALKELGVNAKQVEDWVKAGKPTYDSLTNDGRKYPTKVAEALVQFVDESIMRPNPAQRPILASHPGAMLMYHLKGYMYAIGDVYVGRLAHNVKTAQTPAQTLAALAPALGMMALTAVGLELRELVTEAGTNRTAHTNRMDGWEYIYETFERSGFLAHYQILSDVEGASSRNMSEFLGLTGPAIGHAAEVLQRPVSQTLPKSIPIVSQLPALRDQVRKVL